MKITSFCFDRLNNAYHVAFHQQIEKVLTNAGASATGIQESDLSRYRDALERLQDAVLRTQGSDKTPLLKQLDEKRDSYFRYVRNVFANLRFSSDDSMRALYETANAKILKLYPASITKESYQEEYAHIAGFIVDVRKFFESDLTKLGVKDMLTNLEQANEAFQKAFADRAEELSLSETGYTAQCRAQVDEAYERMILAINYYASRSDSSDESIMSYHSNSIVLIPVINEIISQIWQSIKLAKALKKEGPNSGNGSNSSSGGYKPSGGPNSGNGGSSSGNELN